ncbi:MAG: methyltransferase domain-containing protein [Thermodesulfobacteriota bacterium]
MNDQALPPSLLSKLRCHRCRGSDFVVGDLHLQCGSCRAEYPVVDGRFPDFLSEEQRSALQKELDFWEGHCGDTVYESESEASYARWAGLVEAGPGDEVIELGCGSGALLRRLPAGLRVGLEPVQGLLTATQGFSGVIGAVEDLPFQDECFDIVYFNYSLHHVVDKELGLAEAARITRPGGRLIVIEPNGDHPQRRLVSNPDSRLRRCRLLVGFIGQVESFFSADDIIRLSRGREIQVERLIYQDNMNARTTFRDRLQRLYAILARPFLPENFIQPTFFLSFRKTGSDSRHPAR